MTKYRLIDPALSQWAVRNDVHWFTDYQGNEVRTFYINESQRDRVQVAVDVVENQQVIITVGQNENGIPRLNRVKNLLASMDELTATLDRAFEIAKEWASK